MSRDYTTEQPPLVSIVVATYNDVSYLIDTLLDCDRQTYLHREIIVVDDGSIDGTAAALEEMVEPAIRYVYQPHSGLAAARNRGIRESRGRYIQFLDADDRLAPDKIERQVDTLTSLAEGAIGFCDYRVFDDETPWLRRRRGPRHGFHWPASLKRQFVQWTVIHRFLFPRSVLVRYGGFDEQQFYAEDLDLWLRLMIGGVPFSYDPAPMALYRFRHGHSMRSPFGEALGHLRVLRKLDCLFEDREEGNRYLQDLRWCRAFWAGRARRSGA